MCLYIAIEQSTSRKLTILLKQSVLCRSNFYVQFRKKFCRCVRKKHTHKTCYLLKHRCSDIVQQSTNHKCCREKALCRAAGHLWLVVGFAENEISILAIKLNYICLRNCFFLLRVLTKTVLKDHDDFCCFSFSFHFSKYVLLDMKKIEM